LNPTGLVTIKLIYYGVAGRLRIELQLKQRLTFRGIRHE
jgi:hypothetical protein